MVDDLISERKSIYGINTGFGKFASTVIPDDQLEYNLYNQKYIINLFKKQ